MAEKKVSLSIRLLPEDKMRIKRFAGEAGLTVSDYIMAAVQERLKRDEIPMEERSDLDLMQGALTKMTEKKPKNKATEILDDKSLMDLIGDYVEKEK
jgi:hypothetical protein